MEAIVKRTDDHSIFKHLVGNRSVARSRVEKIKESIKKVGYITNPIIVNERYQIIDGQGREQALAELGLPVDFIVVEGTGINECRSMNIYQSNWKIDDYIWSYAEQGDPSYIRLLHLLKRYKKDGFDYKAISSVLCKGLGEMSSVFVMNGGVVISEEDKNKAVVCIEWLKPLVGILEDVDCGSIKSFIQVLVWCYYNPKINNDRLVDCMKKKTQFITPAINAQQASSVIENVYDYHRSEKSFLSLEFMKDKHHRKRSKRAKRHEEETA